MDKINELYPESRIKKSKDRLTRLWEGERPIDRYPFTYGGMLFGYYEAIHTHEERLKITLDEIYMRGHMNDDFIPSLFPGCKPTTIPAMFGAGETRIGDDYTAERIIKSYDDIDKLPEPVIAGGAREWIELQEYVLEATDGTLPVHVTDSQGPVDVAAAMWGYDNLFLAAYERPECYHRLLEKTTRAFIMYWKAQRDLLGDLFIPTHLFGWNWVPDSAGASLSADSLVMVSGDFFDEFFAPYIAEIGREFGGACVHSCGDFGQLVKNLMAVPGLKGINASQMTVERLVDTGLDGKTVAVAMSGANEAGAMFDLVREKDLRVDLTVFSIWPHRDGRFVPVEEMTDELWDELKRKDDMVIEGARI